MVFTFYNFKQRIVDWLAQNFKREQALLLSSLTQTNIRYVAISLFLCLLCISGSLSFAWSLRKAFCFSSLPFITATADGPKHIDTSLTRVKFEELCSDLLDRYTFWQLLLAGFSLCMFRNRIILIWKYQCMFDFHYFSFLSFDFEWSFFCQSGCLLARLSSVDYNCYLIFRRLQCKAFLQRWLQRAQCDCKSWWSCCSWGCNSGLSFSCSPIYTVCCSTY